MITFEDIEGFFDGAYNPAFITMPKIFIYDCCRGSRQGDAIEVNYNLKGNRPRNNCLHKDSNKIRIYATTKGYTTPDTEKGSFLTQSIHHMFFEQNASNNYSERRENILKLNVFEMWGLIKYETEKISKGYQCVQYVTTQNSKVFLKYHTADYQMLQGIFF